jgi:hypothetical protein
MKRRKVPPLLAIGEPPTYVIDTSAWFNVNELGDAATAWAIIQLLIATQRLVVPPEVIEELKLDDDVWSRLQPLERQFRLVRSDEDYLKRVGLISATYPGLARIRSKKTRADPFVIALAELEELTVVCDESKKKPSRKIPGVCEIRRVKCISLTTMLADERHLLEVV